MSCPAFFIIMKRFEYYSITKLVIMAEDRGQAEEIWQTEPKGEIQLGHIVLEEPFWSLPGEQIASADSAGLNQPAAQIDYQQPVVQAVPLDNYGGVDGLLGELAGYMERNKVSQPKVARALKVSAGTVSAWLAKKWSPAPRMQKRIWEYLRGTK